MALLGRNGNPTASGRGGGASGGGVPAAHLPQLGNLSRGLFIGLENESAGPDWLLDMRARNEVETLPVAALSGTQAGNRLDVRLPSDYERPSISTGGNWRLEVAAGTPAETPDVAPVAATATFNFVSSIGPILAVTMPTELATGADGNGWTMRFLGDNSGIASPVVVTVDEAARSITVQKQSGTITWAQIVTAINAALGAGSAVPTYRGTTTATSNAPIGLETIGVSNQTFTGGVNGRMNPVQATASITESGRTLTATIASSAAEGTAGNGWTLRVNAADAGVTINTANAVVDASNRRITVSRGLGVTMDNIGSAIRAVTGWGASISGGGGSTLRTGTVFTATFAGGADGRDSNPRDPLSAGIERRDAQPGQEDFTGGTITITAIATDTLDEIAAVVNGLDYEVRYGPGALYQAQTPPYSTNSGGLATVMGSGSDVLLSSLLTNPGSGAYFSEGVDIEPIHGSVDLENKIVQLHYAPADTLGELKEFLDGERLETTHTRLLATEIAETDLTASPVAPGSTDIPFVDYYSDGVLPRPDPSAAGTETAAQIAAKLDAFIGNADWRSRLSAQDLVDAIDTATGSNVWRTSHTALRSAQQIINLLDGAIGTTWRTGTGGGTSGVTLEQATDAAGALLATLSQFTYNASTNTLTFAIGDNTILPAKARANSAAHKTEWLTRFGAASEDDVPEEWTDIANGDTVGLGKIVIHSGAYFGCITGHTKGSTGPDGDPTNWTLLSNWRGDWSAAWYPAGAFVRHAGLPWVATAVVAISDPAPDAATNTKWLQLGATQATVVSAAVNTIIPASGRGNTYVQTGSTARRFSLPDASGGSSVPVGWEVVCANRSSADMNIAPDGADTINGSAALDLPAGEAVRLQKTADGQWTITADTRQGSSSSSPSGIDDNSITPDKAQADTAVRRAAWRARLGSAHIGAVTSLPALNSVNDGDIVDFVQDASGQSFVDLRSQDTTQTDAKAGDVMQVLTLRSTKTWVRLGNLIAGSILAQNNEARVENLEDQTADIVVLRTETWTLATAAQGGITTVETTEAALIAKLRAGTLDPSADLTSKVWANNVNITEPNGRYVILRTDTDESVDDFGIRFNDDDGYRHFYPYWFAVAQGDYNYHVWRTSAAAEDVRTVGGRLRLYHRSSVAHNRYDGELGGRALEQLDAVDQKAEANTTALARVSPYFIKSIPEGIHDSTSLPEAFQLVFTEKQTDKTLSDISVTVAGQPAAISPTTPVTNIDATTGAGVLEFGLAQSSRNNIVSNIVANDREIPLNITLTFTDGSVFAYNLPFLVNAVHLTPPDSPSRFERTVGASGAAGNIPVGTHELSVLVRVGSASQNRHIAQRILLSDIPATDRVFWNRGDAGDETIITMRYAAATRTLTYSSASTNTQGSGILVNIKAIGEA